MSLQFITNTIFSSMKGKTVLFEYTCRSSIFETSSSSISSPSDPSFEPADLYNENDEKQYHLLPIYRLPISDHHSLIIDLKNVDGVGIATAMG
jgi:hypothetical protein